MTNHPPLLDVNEDDVLVAGNDNISLVMLRAQTKASFTVCLARQTDAGYVKFGQYSMTLSTDLEHDYSLPLGWDTEAFHFLLKCQDQPDSVPGSEVNVRPHVKR